MIPDHIVKINSDDTYTVTEIANRDNKFSAEKSDLEEEWVEGEEVNSFKIYIILLKINM